ncbi:MAG: hypothetical protein M1826_006210 [Phylliscum demangeonii]|nr:MAG: hypothetical protein M1826_006210 [Phylliscum demangeonii]
MVFLGLNEVCRTEEEQLTELRSKIQIARTMRNEALEVGRQDVARWMRDQYREWEADKAEVRQVANDGKQVIVGGFIRAWGEPTDADYETWQLFQELASGL